jgi:predicted nucleic acid-binding protein
VRIVFADTGYWEALLNPSDRLHAKAIEVSTSLGKVRQLTTEMVLDELLAALSKIRVRPFAVQGASMRSGLIPTWK